MQLLGDRSGRHPGPSKTITGTVADREKAVRTTADLLNGR
jgi:hypothetical protein